MLVCPFRSNIATSGAKIELLTRFGVDMVVGSIVRPLSGIAMNMSKGKKVRNNQGGLSLEWNSFGLCPPSKLSSTMNA